MASVPQTGAPSSGRRAQFAWCLYDWANSGFPTVIVTFVFAAYFSRAVAENQIEGTAAWGQALAVSGVLIAVLSPVLGSIADRTGRRKPWLGAFAAITVAATALLWYTRPDPTDMLWALVFFVIANTAFEIGNVFYNAMLPGLVSKERIGRLSGWSWGLGYMGGLACLGLLLVLFVQAGTPLFGLDKQQAEHVRIVGPMVALWFAVFAIPTFLWVPDEAGIRVRAGEAIRDGLAQLVSTLREIRRHANIARFLLARLFYVDGMNTMFAFGGIYAAGTFGMSFEEIIQFGIALNVTAGLGAAGFAWLDDRIGSKRTVQIGIVGLIAIRRAAAGGREQDGVLAAGAPARHFHGAGAGGEPVADGASRPRRAADRDVRALCAVRKGHLVRRSRCPRLGDAHLRVAARRDDDDHRLLRGRARADDLRGGAQALGDRPVSGGNAACR